MKISIVTVSFNQRKFLKEALDSVLDQRYGDLEYIVVDPGSTDGSRELIESYTDRLSKILMEPDRGAADGLNKGFEFATGEVCGFLNSDDLLMPGSLQMVAEFFERHPECDIAMGNGHKVDGDGNRFANIKARDFTVQRHLYGGTRWLQQSTFFRREAYLRSPRFNIVNRTCWDGEMFLNMLICGAKVGYINSDLAAFRIHGESISGTGRLNDIYRDDLRRMFRQVKGRDWGTLDKWWMLLYRVEGIMLRATERIGITGKRITE
jgi:glycosyltransferase involved in cell wall biosynthesis